MSDLHAAVLRWYDEHARDLPWRRPEATPWSVMVSEVMLQQTPVARVLPVHEEWLRRWPTPVDLAAAPSGEAVRVWGRLGYPRRALRLWQSATLIRDRHGGQVPDDVELLRRLPGVGDYTAAAVAAFGHGRRAAVLDTNVRRVHARALAGVEFPPDRLSTAERTRAEDLLPDDPATAVTWSVAVMELGALVCTARRPACAACPIADRCAWRAAGYPPYDGPPRRGQAWAGTDRQVRGRIMALVREADGPVRAARLTDVWHDTGQRDRCLASLLDDGLLVAVAGGAAFALPD